MITPTVGKHGSSWRGFGGGENGRGTSPAPSSRKKIRRVRCNDVKNIQDIFVRLNGIRVDVDPLGSPRMDEMKRELHFYSESIHKIVS